MNQDDERQHGDTPGPDHTVVLVEDDIDGMSAVELISHRPAAQPAGKPEESLGAASTVWRRQFATIEEAEAFLHWFLLQAHRWATWSMLASVIGRSMLGNVIDAEGAADLWLGAEANGGESDDHSLRIICLGGELLGRPAIALQRSDESEPFWEIAFEEPWERARLLDWMRWQASQLQAWHAHWREHGAFSLQCLILTGMIDAEESIRAMGNAADDCRPLRGWRPD